MNRTGTYIGDSPELNIGNQNVRFSLALVEEYVSGKNTIRTAAQSPVYFRAGSFPTGWNTATLTFTNCNGTTGTLNAQFGGTWKQYDSNQVATLPIPYEYC